MHKDNDHRLITTVVNEKKKKTRLRFVVMVSILRYWFARETNLLKEKNQRQRPCGSFVLVFAADEERLYRVHDSIHPITDGAFVILCFIVGAEQTQVVI